MQNSTHAGLLEESNRIRGKAKESVNHPEEKKKLLKNNLLESTLAEPSSMERHAADGKKYH